MLIRQFVAAAGLALLLVAPASAEVISPQQAAQNIGHTTTVEGEVSQVSTSRSGVTFINFGDHYPNHSFYAVIFRDDAGRFPGVMNLEGQTVAITGELELYRGKAQIILQSPDQISIR